MCIVDFLKEFQLYCQLLMGFQVHSRLSKGVFRFIAGFLKLFQVHRRLEHTDDLQSERPKSV
jgi:hypothetical protein